MTALDYIRWFGDLGAGDCSATIWMGTRIASPELLPKL